MDKPVYASEGLAKELWNSFTTVVTLDTMSRQDGQSNEHKTFRHLLMNVRDAIPTLEDWKILMTRTDTSLDASMKEPFDKAIHLFATNDDVHNHNKRLIRSLNCPIAASIATSIRRNYSMERDEEDLELELLIVVGARVMLTSNLWTDAGLVNGALGVIQHIVYNPGSSPPEPPTYVLVRFDNYLGVPWDESIPQVVPITPIEKVQVCNLSPKATVRDVKQFFSYSGTVKKAKLERSGQWAQVAFVTFQEPYALETAVILNEATIIDQTVYIMPWGESEEAVNRWKKQMMKLQEEDNTQGLSSYIPSARQAVNVVTTMLSMGYTLGKDTLSKANELDKKYQIIDTAAANVTSFGKFVGEKSKAALIVAGQAAYSAGTAAVNSSYFASGALMVSGALDKAAKATADLANRRNTET